MLPHNGCAVVCRQEAHGAGDKGWLRTLCVGGAGGRVGGRVCSRGARALPHCYQRCKPQPRRRSILREALLLHQVGVLCRAQCVTGRGECSGWKLDVIEVSHIRTCRI